MQIIHGNAPDTAQPTSKYSNYTEVRAPDRWLYVSGQIPVASDGTVPTAFNDQATLAWTNVMAQLAAASMDASNLVKVTIFLSDRRYAEENRAIRQRFLDGFPTALTVIITGIFDSDWLLEIEAVAAA